PEQNVIKYEIMLKDEVYPLHVVLHYKAFEKQDVIEQWSSISHTEKRDVTLTKFASANLHLKAKEYYLTQYHGDWAKEMRPEESKLTHGIKVLDSKLGTRANLFQPSVFMVSLDQPATEEEGTVLYGALAWSGNFRTDLELDFQDNLRIISGMNSYASAYSLAPKEVFETPKFIHILSQNGKGSASRRLHDWAREFKIADGEGSRYTLLNNWEATYFDFDESKLFELIKDAKDLDVDLFLLDDGWFGNEHPRNNDDAGLGDWQENKKKLPNGVASLVSEASKHGVKFGIWLEPEMVNPESELYKKHPDWVIKQPKRNEYYFRNQLVLDLSNPDVQDFVFGVVNDLLSDNPDLAYIKWDANSLIYNAHSTYLKKQSHLYIKYVQGLYDVLKRVREKYPKIPIMLCSGGGGRVDYGALEFFTEFWPSDNTDPLERIFMQWEYSHFYPAISTANHVTEWGSQPLKFKTDVAMMGKLGFDIVVNELEEKDLSFAKSAVKNYDTIKDIIWQGDLYRLSDPKENDVASLMYVDDNRSSGVVFNYLVNSRYDVKSRLPIVWKGLDPTKQYKVKEINLYPDSESALKGESTYSGEFLMTVGFNPKLDNQRSSVILSIEATN
ncbi:MAG: alpha-galactosidase, partial [Cyclobacteriaceae bacterium]